MKAWILAGALVLATWFLVGSPLASAGGVTGNDVTIAGFTFVPTNPVVASSQARVVVNNADVVPHTFSSDSGLWTALLLQPGQTVSVANLPPGTYAYHCDIHFWMHGVLVVH
jgi:plastocyanin